jgi:galactose-1-phosphate uridylyltransferase
MPSEASTTRLFFRRETVAARFLDVSGQPLTRTIEIRENPITGRRCRITFSRAAEKEPGAPAPASPPAEVLAADSCPFCPPRRDSCTPGLMPDLASGGRLVRGDAVLFPNLFPYGRYSAVSLFDTRHFVPIGSADPLAYTRSFRNAADYLDRVRRADPAAVYWAITQNHLPSAGGSLVHPHLQVHADRLASNHHRFLEKRSADYFVTAGRHLLGDYLTHEKRRGTRCIGRTGDWEWVAAFAPEGFFEIWGLLPGCCRITAVTPQQWADLARGVLNTQRFYRRLGRNGYNLGLLAVEVPESRLELRVVILARANYAPWTRSDHTAYEVMLGDMATFTAPEETAVMARSFWQPVPPAA